MKVVQYDEWKIAVDVAKTKAYYNAYKANSNQANRNFAKYCENLTSEEKDFFASFGITPTCCEIEHIGADKKGNFPCGGYYLICGKYLKYPSEELTTIEELAEHDFIDERPDTRVYIGMFEFDFQYENYVFHRIPEDMPQGFICIRFWCEDMKWLLSEKPEEMMYEPPQPWEIHKRINERIKNKKVQAASLKASRAEFMQLFEALNIEVTPLSKREIRKYKKEWVARFAPPDANQKEIRKLCLASRKYNTFLWHMFSFEFLNCETDAKAEELFDEQKKSHCVIVSNVDDLAFTLKNADHLKSKLLEKFVDVTITSSDFTWTYTKTHEEQCGPYFYMR